MMSEERLRRASQPEQLNDIVALAETERKESYESRVGKILSILMTLDFIIIRITSLSRQGEGNVNSYRVHTRERRERRI